MLCTHTLLSFETCQVGTRSIRARVLPQTPFRFFFQILLILFIAPKYPGSSRVTTRPVADGLHPCLILDAFVSSRYPFDSGAGLSQERICFLAFGICGQWIYETKRIKSFSFSSYIQLQAELNRFCSDSRARISLNCIPFCSIISVQLVLARVYQHPWQMVCTHTALFVMRTSSGRLRVRSGRGSWDAVRELTFSSLVSRYLRYESRESERVQGFFRRCYMTLRLYGTGLQFNSRFTRQLYT
jgi:hypothetical protein